MFTTHLLRERDTYEQISRFIALLTRRDTFTAGHISRLEPLAQNIADMLELTEAERIELLLATCLHDCGKIAIPNEIINKPGKLTESEWQLVRSHPIIGYALVKSSLHIPRLAANILYHHENWNGTGYPTNREGTRIPLIARIIRVIDSYDAMTNDRPYRDAICKRRALTELKMLAGIYYDPIVVDALIAIIE